MQKIQQKKKQQYGEGVERLPIYLELREAATQASQPLSTVALATRLTPSVKAPIRRSQLWFLHISFTSLKPFVMYVFSSLFTFSSSHMKPWMFCICIVCFN